MADRSRWIRRQKTCKKVPYRNEGLARRAARSIARVERIAIYQCSVCRFPDDTKCWHWGHKRYRGDRNI